MSISIKDVDKTAFRNLKAEAIRRGIKVGDAASEAFEMWAASKRETTIRDRESMTKASATIDKLREESRIKWSGESEIRKWRNSRK